MDSMPINVLENKQRILDKTLANLCFKSEGPALDVGCGDGSYYDFLLQKSSEVIGFDIKSDLKWGKIRKGKIGEKLSFLVASVFHMPFPDENFGFVFEKDTLHHVEDPIKALKEIFRVTKTKGYIVCIEKNRLLRETLMKRYDHFTKTFFEHLMKAYSKNIIIISMESRTYPLKNKQILHIIHYFEEVLETLPFIRNFLCYNIAIIQKE